MLGVMKNLTKYDSVEHSIIYHFIKFDLQRQLVQGERKFSDSYGCTIHR